MILARSEVNSVLTDDPDGYGVVTGAYLFSPLLGSSDILNYRTDNDGSPMDGEDGRPPFNQVILKSNFESGRFEPICDLVLCCF